MDLTTILLVILLAPLAWGLGQIFLGIIIGLIGIFLD